MPRNLNSVRRVIGRFDKNCIEFFIAMIHEIMHLSWLTLHDVTSC